MEEVEDQLIKLVFIFKRMMLAQEFMKKRTIFVMEDLKIHNFLPDGNISKISLVGKEIMFLKLAKVQFMDSTFTHKSFNLMLMQAIRNIGKSLIYLMMETTF